MGTNLRTSELYALPEPFGQCFKKLDALAAGETVAIWPREAAWLRRVIGSVEHLKHYGASYSKQVCRSLFSTDPSATHDDDSDASYHMNEVVEAMSAEQILLLVNSTDPETLKANLKHALASVVHVGR